MDVRQDGRSARIKTTIRSRKGKQVLRELMSSVVSADQCPFILRSSRRPPKTERAGEDMSPPIGL